MLKESALEFWDSEFSIWKRELQIVTQKRSCLNKPRLAASCNEDLGFDPWVVHFHFQVQPHPGLQVASLHLAALPPDGFVQVGSFVLLG